MIDLSELMPDTEMGARSFTLRRPSGGFANEGEWDSNYIDTAVIGLVQPARPHEAKLLPEGTRLENVIHVWSATELSPGNGKDTVADVLVIDGASFRVIKINPWREAGFTDVFAEGFVTS